MLQIGSTLVSLDLIQEHFMCDLEQCKGACCVEGDSGAPLEEAELEQLENSLPAVLPYLTEAGKASLKEYGAYVLDTDGDYVTPLVEGNRECAYTIFKGGIASCGIEKAWNDGKVSFRKPVSCHLYPVRIQSLKDYDAVNYHKWSICSPGCRLGKKNGMPLYVFLKDALIRKYGEDWYRELDETAKAYLSR